MYHVSRAKLTRVEYDTEQTTYIFTGEKKLLEFYNYMQTKAKVVHKCTTQEVVTVYRHAQTVNSRYSNLHNVVENLFAQENNSQLNSEF